MNPPQPAPRLARARVWLALLAMPVVLAAVLTPVVATLAIRDGLRGDALLQAVQRVAPAPTALGFVFAFLLTRWLARQDGLTLAALGWARARPSDVVTGLVAGAALGGLNRVALHPLVQAAQPGFDPTLAALPLPAMAATLLVAVVAEDTLYRGYALQVLRARLGTPLAVVVSTLCYALLTPGQGLALVLWAGYFGLVLCGLRLWRKSLWPVAIAHALVALGPRLLSAL